MVQVRTNTATERILLEEKLTSNLGPLPALQDRCHTPLVHELRQNVRNILGLDSDQPPEAVVLFTAHWQSHQPAISASEDSHLYYDYRGFPEEGYSITHNGKGSPHVANRVFELLQRADFEPVLNTDRG